jgi:hypothetical protein
MVGHCLLRLPDRYIFRKTRDGLAERDMMLMEYTRPGTANRFFRLSSPQGLE